MPEPLKFGELDFKLVSSMEDSRSLPTDDDQFRIVILGDFSGRAGKGISKSGLAGMKPLLVDRDNFDEVLRKLNAEIKLSILGKDSLPVNVSFSNIDDFHPDSLYERIEVFRALKETREGLRDPAIFAPVSEKTMQDEQVDITPIISALEKDAKTGGDAGLLDRVIEESEGSMTRAGSGQSDSRSDSEMEGFLKKITSPHIVPNVEREHAGMIASVDAASSELMRRIIHHTDFQAIESAWRAVYFLISRLETDEQIKLYLFDISKEELAADLSSANDLRKTGIYSLLVEQTVGTFGGEPWTVIAGNYVFKNDINDIGLLGRIGKIARAAGAPFISSVSDKFPGCKSLAESPNPDDWRESEDDKAWNTLRKIPEASYLGLALPRFLLRLPYGTDTIPLERFMFEEMGNFPVHEHYLWGNPLFICVCLLAQSFISEGWEFQQDQLMEIEGMPLHVYKENGDAVVKPCVEVVLTEKAAEKILDKGIMPLLSFRNQDIIRLARFQSVADPPANLSGKW